MFQHFQPQLCAALSGSALRCAPPQNFSGEVGRDTHFGFEIWGSAAVLLSINFPGNKGVWKGVCDPKLEFPSCLVVQPENLLLASIQNTHFLTAIFQALHTVGIRRKPTIPYSDFLGQAATLQIYS